MHTTLTTPRLTLAPLSSDDNSFIYTLVNSPGWLEFISDGIGKSPEDIAPYIEKIMNNYLSMYWVIRMQDSTPIGIITFLKRNYLEYYDLGFALLPHYTGHGYAYEAAACVLQTLAASGKYPVIMATTIPSNTTSQHLLEKLGFTFVAELIRDDLRLMVYDIVADTVVSNH